MIDDQFRQLENEIEHKVRGIVDDHPLTRHLSDVARRNMAYCAGGAAVSALTEDEVKAALSPKAGGRT